MARSSPISALIPRIFLFRPFEIFTPLFEKVTPRLDPHYTKGGTFTITAIHNPPQNGYILSANLNGAPLDRCWLDYKEIATGGTLELVLGPAPNTHWSLAAQ